jgi:hypothetical protein
MSENQTPPTISQEQMAPTPATALNPVTKKIVERCIQEVLTEYVQQTKQFTADSMHYLRVKVTDLVKQRLGDDEIVSVDLGLDLANLEDIPFFFKINIPKEKVEEHLIKQTAAPSETPPQ